MNRNGILLAALAALLPLTSLNAEQPTASQIKFFETSIRPALIQHCYKCHSVEAGDSRAGLLLDSRQGWSQGGDSGPAIVPGKPSESLLWEAINWESNEMPPSKKMPADVIAKFKQWIEMGAPDPRERKLLVHKTKITAADIEQGRKHWAFQTPVAEPGSSIDKLVAAKLQQAKLEPVGPADAYTLLRRINFDLIGLPPSPAEIQAFKIAFQRSPDVATNAKIDELLKRPQYGERWGRHWLDVARYAESSGSRNVGYPHAWRYRNYVIDSFNDDTPYNRFLAEQIAGDLLLAKTDAQWQENLIATGFLAIGMKHHDEKNPRKFMADMVDEQIDTMTQGMLGLTVSCARCHDHKYDPVPTSDYYALAGIFHSTKTYYGTLRVAQNHRPSELLLLPIRDQSTVAANSQQSIASLKERIDQLDQQMAGKRGKDRRTIRNSRNRIAGQLAALNPDGTPKAFGMGVQEAPQMVNANILFGGEVDQPAQQVPRGFVQVLGKLNFTVNDLQSSGRLELAKAIASKENPLTSRVMVNRIWMHLAGKPLVGTPSNFGFSGMKPENQELLDYLAVRFMDLNWSVKGIVREIVMSNVYRRGSTYNEANYKVDPENKLLWRANPRQLDAESLRDAMLTVSGEIDLKRPAVATVSGRPGARTESESSHRSVYLPVVRDGLPAALELFDFPDPNITSAGRSHSIVPTQALYMMNGAFVTQQAEAMADSLQRQFKDPKDQVRMAFLAAYGRHATPEELRASSQFFRDFKSANSVVATSKSTQTASPRSGRRGPSGRQLRSTGATASKVSDPALAVFCQTLIASARFRILN